MTSVFVYTDIDIDTDLISWTHGHIDVHVASKLPFF